MTWSTLMTVAMTWISLRKPFGHSGRTGRSVMRAVRIARSLGRLSRLMNPPGIFPAAYMRSSTSTVSGKKSTPSRGVRAPTAVTRTRLSPDRTTTAPFACLASLPVSNVIGVPPTSAFTTASAISFLISAGTPWPQRSSGVPASSDAGDQRECLGAVQLPDGPQARAASLAGPDARRRLNGAAPAARPAPGTLRGPCAAGSSATGGGGRPS